MKDFIHRQGPAYLAHIFRRLADELVRGGAEWYPEAGVSAPPRTTSTLLALDEHGPLGVTELSSLLRQSHPLVIDWRRQLTELGFVETRRDPEDGRRSVLMLTVEGRREVRRLRRALVVMEKASQRLMTESGPDLFAALWRMDEALQRRSFADQLRDHAARSKSHSDRPR